MAAFRAKQKLNFPLVGDPSHKMLEAYGVWRTKHFMGRSFTGIVRSTFLIGADGNLEAVWNGVKVHGHVSEVLAAASK